MADFSHFAEIWTGGVTDLGTSKEIKLLCKAVFTDGTHKWISKGYEGTFPGSVGTEEVIAQPPVRFPEDFNLLADFNGLMVDLGIQAVRDLLTK